MIELKAIYIGDKKIDKIIGSNFININQDKTTVNIYINQSGYDIGKSKRATITNVGLGENFVVKSTSDNSIVYTGEINGQIADFTNLNTEGEYYIECKGVTSYNFKIAENYIISISQGPALRFMAQSRQDVFNVGGDTGYGWRDSHQFSFEINSLVLQYMSNPSYYKSLDYGIENIDTCEYEELRTQNEPDIIWLIKFGVLRYYKWYSEKSIKLHALIKGQLAYFLYLYPYITDYVSKEFYTTIRDFTLTVWSYRTCNKAWYEVDGGINNNLYSTQEKIGNIKGQLPAGYGIIPNLLMWEVAKRDGLDNADNFKEAWLNNLS